MPVWRNWQTHRTQNAAGNRTGSSPVTGTIKTEQAFACSVLIMLMYHENRRRFASANMHGLANTADFKFAEAITPILVLSPVTDDIPCGYDICFADDIRFAYEGTDIIMSEANNKVLPKAGSYIMLA